MKKLKILNWSLFLVLFIYNILDAWYTQLLLETGLIIEANPIMNYFLNLFNVKSFYYIKIILFCFLGFCIYKLHNKKESK